MIDKDILEMSQKKYADMIDDDSYVKTKDGKIKLIPSESYATKNKAMLTTNINLLEERLKAYKDEKVKIDTVRTEYPTKKKKKKKLKKEKETILKMIFNNAEAKNEEREEELEDEYKDNKESKRGGNKQKTDKLDSTYGQRFSPVISLLYDSINEFDEIITTIEEDLSAAGTARTRYKTDQMGNLISAKNAKLSAIKEIGSLSKTISDLEYKKDKDNGKDAEGDSTKALSALGVKFLKGTFEEEDNKKKKKQKEKKTRINYLDDDDDDEDDDFKIKKKNSDKELAGEFAKSVFSKKDKLSLTPYEKHIDMEGKYTIVIVADSDDIEESWKFAAVDTKGKEIKDFKDEYKDLLPKKKNVKLVFDLNKMKVVDKNTSKSYKLILK